MEPLKVIKPEWEERWSYFLNLHTRRACCHSILRTVMVAGNKSSVFFENNDGNSSVLTNVDTLGFGNEVHSATAAGDLILVP